MAVDYDTIRQIALALPNVEDGMSYGAPALKVGGALMVRLREDLDAIVLLTTFDEREAMMAEQPATYFITDHYLKYPYVLVSLSTVHENALRELFSRAYELARAAKKKKRAKHDPKFRFGDRPQHFNTEIIRCTIELVQ